MEKGLKKFRHTWDDEGLFAELVDEYVYSLCLGRVLREGLENEVRAQSHYVHYDWKHACVFGHIRSNAGNLDDLKRVKIKEYKEMVCGGCCLEKWNIPPEVREIILKHAFAPILFIQEREELLGQIVDRISSATGVKIINQRIV
jgi:hypothetical protein